MNVRLTIINVESIKILALLKMFVDIWRRKEQTASFAFRSAKTASLATNKRATDGRYK